MLQRSGGRTLPAVLVLFIPVGLALSAAVLFRAAGADYSERLEAAAPLDEPAALAGEATPPATQAAPLAMQSTTLPTKVEPAAAKPTPKARSRPASAQRSPKTPNYPLYKAVTPQEDWERQRRDYDRARAAYDANEQAEGFQWARRNGIKLARHCRAAQERTPAFMQGCMNYLRTVEAKASGNAPEGALTLLVR